MFCHNYPKPLTRLLFFVSMTAIGEQNTYHKMNITTEGNNYMKRFYTIVMLCCAVMLLCCAALAEDGPGFALVSQHMTVEAGTTVQVPYVQSNVKDPLATVLTWSIDEPAVASVQPGKVTGVADGTAVITCTATFSDGTTQTDTCTVQVVTSVRRVKAEYTMYCLPMGKQETVPVTIEPANATDQRLVWASSDPRIAEVDPETGVITGNKLGECIITATAMDGSNQTARFYVTVEPFVMMDIRPVQYSGTSWNSTITYEMRSQCRRAKIRGFGIKLLFLDKDKQIVAACRENCFESDTLVAPGARRRFIHESRVISPSYIAAVFTEFVLPEGQLRTVTMDDQLPAIYDVHRGHLLNTEETLAFLDETDLAGVRLRTRM